MATAGYDRGGMPEQPEDWYWVMIIVYSILTVVFAILKIYH